MKKKYNYIIKKSINTLVELFFYNLNISYVHIISNNNPFIYVFF